MVHCEIKHRKCAYSSKTLLMNTLNSGRVNHLLSSNYRSYNRIPQSKSMHIRPWGLIETDPSASSYFVTLSLEYPKAPSSSLVRSLIGLFVSSQKQSGIQCISTSVMQWWNFGSSLIDGEFYLILYVPVNIFSVVSGWVSLG